MPIGWARRANRAVLALTLGFGGVALALMLRYAVAAGATAAAFSGLIFAATLTLSSLASFLYHWLERTRRRGLLRYLDHAAIFLLIAGTYTPVAVIGLPSAMGRWLLGAIWALALLGITLKLVLGTRHDRWFVAFYLAMGWLFIAFGVPLLRALPGTVLGPIVLGGGAYTVGALIYSRDPGPWTDAVWHGFVLAGGIAHLVAVLRLLPG